MRRIKILIVEDEKIIALDLQMIIRKLKHDIVGVCDTAEGAVEKALQFGPDLVLMDVNLKGTMSGIDAAFEIKRLLNNTKVVFITGQRDRETSLLIEQTNFSCINKPFNETELHGLINTLAGINQT